MRVMQVDISWNDIESFNAFDEMFEKNENFVIVKDKIIFLYLKK